MSKEEVPAELRQEQGSILICPILLNVIKMSGFTLAEFFSSIEQAIEAKKRAYRHLKNNQPDEESVSISGLGPLLNDDPATKSRYIEQCTGITVQPGSIELQSIAFHAGKHLVMFVWDKNELTITYHRDVPHLSVAAYPGRQLAQFMAWDGLAGVECLITETRMEQGKAIVTAVAPEKVTADYAAGMIIR